MRPFEYRRAGSLDEALSLLEDADARVLAGGTDLLVRAHLGHISPKVVVDVKQIPELASVITEVDGFVRVGAGIVMTDLMADDRLRRYFPALVESAAVVGSIQIRNRATLAGNICNASPAADTAPALLVYGAIVNVVSRNARRRVPIEDFFAGPGRTVLGPGELVESIDLPIPREPAGAAFGRITRRRGVDLATVNLCCMVTASGAVRFGYGAVGPRPFLVTDTDGVLTKAGGGEDAALRRITAVATPRTDIRGGRDYREAMLLTLSRRALDAALERRRRANGTWSAR